MTPDPSKLADGREVVSIKIGNTFSFHGLLDKRTCLALVKELEIWATSVYDDKALLAAAERPAGRKGKP